MVSKAIDVMEKMLVVFVSFLFLLIYFLNVVFQDIEYSFKVNFSVKNTILTLLVILLLGLFVWLERKFLRKIQFKKDCWKIILVLSVVLCVVQIFICYHIYFLAGWDPGIVAKNADYLASGQSSQLEMWYFSKYPNNCLLTIIYALFFKTANMAGISSTVVRPMIEFGQCILSSATAYLVYLAVKKMLKSEKWAIVSWCVFVALVGMSPWWSVPYSDAGCIFIPIWMLWIGQCMQNGKKMLAKGIGIGILAFLGYQLKPTTVILFIAIIVIELLACLKGANERTKRIGAVVTSIVTMLVLTVGFHVMDVYKQVGFELDSNQSVGMAHYFMMGLNDETDGGFYYGDILYSESFDTSEERTKGNLKKAKERIKEYGAAGLLKHLGKKTLMNFNDGTFGWWNEGGFRSVESDMPSASISPFFRNIYYEEGSMFEAYRVTMQLVWLLVLLGIICNFMNIFRWDRIQNKYSYFVVMVATLGIFLFVTLFEGRARYLYVYVPILIIASINGYKAVWSVWNYNRREGRR